MGKVEAESLGADVEFPELPRREIPDDELALRRIMSGQLALLEFYKLAADELEDEGRFLANLLRRDWERRSRDLLAAGKEILERLGKGKVREDLPPRGQIQRAAEAQRGATARRFHEAAARIAGKALLCGHIVPWVSDIQEVFEHFKRSLEAEDGHLAMIDTLGNLLEG